MGLGRALREQHHESEFVHEQKKENQLYINQRIFLRDFHKRSPDDIRETTKRQRAH